MMTPEETSQLADAITERLDHTPRTSTLLPPWFAAMLKGNAHGTWWQYSYVVPMGPEGFVVKFKINPDGSLEISLYSMDNMIAWTTVLTSA